MEQYRPKRHRILLYLSLAASLILFSGCATMLVSAAGKKADKWNMTIEHVPLWALTDIPRGEMLLVTVQDGSEYYGKLKKVIPDSVLIIGHLEKNGTYNRWNLEWSDLKHVRHLTTPHHRQTTSVLFSVPFDMVAIAYGLRIGLFFFLVSLFITSF